MCVTGLSPTRTPWATALCIALSGGRSLSPGHHSERLQHFLLWEEAEHQKGENSRAGCGLHWHRELFPQLPSSAEERRAAVRPSPALLMVGCVTWGKVLNLSEPRPCYLSA